MILSEKSWLWTKRSIKSLQHWKRLTFDDLCWALWTPQNIVWILSVANSEHEHSQQQQKQKSLQNETLISPKWIFLWIIYQIQHNNVNDNKTNSKKESTANNFMLLLLSLSRLFVYVYHVGWCFWDVEIWWQTIE